MAIDEDGLTPHVRGVFVSRSEVMDADDVRRALWRMAHEILEHNQGVSDVALIGLQTGGVPLARKLAANLAEIEGSNIPVGYLDVAFSLIFESSDIVLRAVKSHSRRNHFVAGAICFAGRILCVIGRIRYAI